MLRIGRLIRRRRLWRGDSYAECVRADVERPAFVHADAAIQGIEDLLAVSAVADDIAHAQQAEVMTDGGLWKFKCFTETGDVSLAVGEEHQQVESSAIGQQAKQSGQLF